MRYRLNRPRLLLPEEDWPETDRAAWDALFAEGDVLTESGAARHWRPATRATNRGHYARWLMWLARQGLLDPALPPPERVTEERVIAYGRELQATVSPKTVLATLVGLKAVVKRMAPDRDWRWLMDLTNRLKSWATPSIDRRIAMRPLTEIHLEALEVLECETPSTKDRRALLAWRDMMLVLLLSACPLRLRNLTGLRIGTSLVREPSGWVIRVDETETKTGERLVHPLPATLDLPLTRYLAEIRPALRPAPDCDALWLTVSGTPLSEHGVYVGIVGATRRLFGTPINPHAFRACAATTLVEESPEKARLAAPLLGHRDFGTTERFHVKADQIAATRKVTATLALLSGQTQQEDDP